MSPDPDWTSSWTPRQINGVSRDVLTLANGSRSIEAIELDMADQWDFMEIAGKQIDNEPWVSTALLAASVIAIDGIPQPSGITSRDVIRTVLRKIGAAGIDALSLAFERREASAVSATKIPEGITAGN